MAECDLTPQCAFFNSDVGYSPELNHAMKERYCLGDNTGCVRLFARQFFTREEIPEDLLPTDCAGLQRMLTERNIAVDVCAEIERLGQSR